MAKPLLLAPKQKEFILKSNAKINLAHGAVRTGKTTCGVYRFLQAVYASSEAENHWMIGHTASTIKRNAVDMILNPPPPEFPDPFAIFRPFCTWMESRHQLLFGDKVIHTCGVKDKGSTGLIQGATFATCYADEMTLWDPSTIDMAFSRLSRPDSKLFGTMNPTYPTHKLKQWIDWAAEGDKNYYAMHFNIEDNPFVDQNYKNSLKKSLSGVFYKRNYLGLWCLAEGAIFDFFDRSRHVCERPRDNAEYFIAGIDYGTSNAFACVLVGVSTGRYTPGAGRRWWVEKEYYWDSVKMGRQKTSTEFAADVQRFLEPYGVRNVYIDPSALTFKLDLQRLGIHPVNGNNDVENGIFTMTSEMNDGNLYVLSCCQNLIREIEGYVWDPKSCEKGWDEPLKKNDHAIDALRYAIASHRVSNFNEEEYYRKRQRDMRARGPYG